MTTPQAASDALDYLDDMTGVRELDIPGGRSPVAFLSRYGELIRALLTAAAQPAPQVIFETPKSEPNLKSSTVFHEAQPATDTTGEALERVIQRAKAYVSSGEKPDYEIYKQNEQDCLTLRQAALLSKPAAVPIGWQRQSRATGEWSINLLTEKQMKIIRDNGDNVRPVFISAPPPNDERGG